MNITDLLQGDLGNQLIKGISAQEGTSEQQTSSVISAAIPAIMGMLKQNASSEDGASSLTNALNQHDGSILNNLSGALTEQKIADEGNSILTHILGDKKSSLENLISQHTGIEASKISGIIARLAPVVMGFIGQQKASSGLNENSGIGNLISGLVGKDSNGVLSSLLDQDGDGQLGLGDALSAFSKNKKGNDSDQSGGGILGGLFN